MHRDVCGGAQKNYDKATIRPPAKTENEKRQGCDHMVVAAVFDFFNSLLMLEGPSSVHCSNISKTWILSEYIRAYKSLK